MSDASETDEIVDNDAAEHHNVPVDADSQSAHNRNHEKYKDPVYTFLPKELTHKVFKTDRN